MIKRRQVSKKEPGKKFDKGKLGYHLVPWDAVEGGVRVLDYGEWKYAARNWEKGMSWSRVFAGILRHLTAWWMGEDIDPESKMPHLWHAQCGIWFLCAYTRRGMTKFDDRPRKVKS